MTNETALTEKNVMDKLKEAAEIIKRDGFPLKRPIILVMDGTQETPLEALDILHSFAIETTSLGSAEATRLMQIVRDALEPKDQLSAFKEGKLIINAERHVEVPKGIQYKIINDAHWKLEPISQGDSLHVTEKRYKINGKIYSFMWSASGTSLPSIYEVIPA